jgi:hypothetical protein
MNLEKSRVRPRICEEGKAQTKKRSFKLDKANLGRNLEHVTVTTRDNWNTIDFQEKISLLWISIGAEILQKLTTSTVFDGIMVPAPIPLQN